MSLFAELKRRNVFRVAAAYIVSSWVLLQVADVLTGILELPTWAPKLVFLLLLVGFIPSLIFSWAYELTPDGLKREKDVDRGESVAASTGRKIDFAIIGILAVAVIFLVVDRFRSPAENSDAVEASIAVLPFANLSSDPEQEYFSDGITEEILNALATVDGLKVAGRTSSFAFKGRNEDLREIGAALGVAHILNGSVQKGGDKVRIRATLVTADDGYTVWQGNFDRELDDIFAIQDEIAEKILQQLGGQLVDGAATAPTSERTDPEVYNRFLQARQLISQRTRASLEAATDLLDEAINLDPGYSSAYAQRGIATLLLSRNSYGPLEIEESRSIGRHFLDQALELDPDNAEALAGLGLYWTMTPGFADSATDALTRALEINPNLIDARNWLYNVLDRTGETEDAARLAAQILERDPLYRPAFANLVQSYAFLGRMDEARQTIQRFERYYEGDYLLLYARATVATLSGNRAEACRIISQAVRQVPDDRSVRNLFSICLLSSMQIERLVSEGGPPFNIDGFDYLGRRDEALQFGRIGATIGFPGNLLTLWNRAGQSRNVVDWVGERWPNPEAFVRDAPANAYGHKGLIELAVAYRNLGMSDELETAAELLRASISRLQEEGLDNHVFDHMQAEALAAIGEYDSAFEKYRTAMERGFLHFPDLAKASPAFAPLAGDPRVVEADELMAARVNDLRAELELPPYDTSLAAW